jgi:cyclopropane fatty-acyl-phospholipid synthase-like methyltransferase
MVTYGLSRFSIGWTSITLDIIMDNNTMYKDGTYLNNNPKWHEEDSSWKAKQIINMLSKHHITPSKLCEIGCGAGEILNCLASEYTNDAVFYGFEISPQAFAISKKKEKPNLRFFLKDIFDEKDLTFDVVMAIDVFEHIEDYFGFLRKLKTKGTYKIFHIPLDLSVQSVLRSSPIQNARLSVGHIHYFTKETALSTLKDTGYEVIDYFYTNGSLELPNRGLKANLLKLPRKFFFSLHQDLAVRILGGFSLLVLAK